MPGGSDSSGSNMYNISTKSNIRAAHPTNCPYYKIKLKAVQQLNCLQICDTVTTKSTYSAFSPPVQPFCFFSQPETPDSSDQIVLSIISNHDPVRAAACRGGTCAPFSPQQLNGSDRNFTANLTGTMVQHVRGQYFTGNTTFKNLTAPTLMRES